MEVQKSSKKIDGIGQVKGFLSSCGNSGVSVRANNWGRIVLYGPFASVAIMRKQLMAFPDLEPSLLLKLSEQDGNLKNLLSECEAILWAEGLPCSPMDAARGLGCGQGWPEDITE